MSEVPETEAPKPRLRKSMAQLNQEAKQEERQKQPWDIKKVVRLPDGRFITVTLRQSNPKDVARANEDEIWTTGDGRKLLPKDMQMSHLLNVCRLLEGRAEQAARVYEVLRTTNRLEFDLPDFCGQLFPIYVKLRAEVKARMDPNFKPCDFVFEAKKENNNDTPEPQRKRRFDWDYDL